jgi:hypothetical protein
MEFRFVLWNLCFFLSLVRMSEKSKNADLQPILLFSVMTFENNAFVCSVVVLFLFLFQPFLQHLMWQFDCIPILGWNIHEKTITEIVVNLKFRKKCFLFVCYIVNAFWHGRKRWNNIPNTISCRLGIWIDIQVSQSFLATLLWLSLSYVFQTGWEEYIWRWHQMFCCTLSTLFVQGWIHFFNC